MKEQIIKAYRDGIEVNKIQEEFGIGAQKLYGILDENNVERRQERQATKLDNISAKTMDDIVLFYEEGMKVQEIVDLFECLDTPYDLYRVLKHRDVELRSDKKPDKKVEINDVMKAVKVNNIMVEKGEMELKFKNTTIKIKGFFTVEFE